MPSRSGSMMFALALSAIACDRSASRSDEAVADHGRAPGMLRYYCPMHPSYRSDRPGDCPVCNMALATTDADERGAAAGANPSGRVTITLPAERTQLIGVRTGRVERRRVAQTFHAAGRFAVDERRLATVTVKFAGVVDELFVKSVGERVKAGDPLLAVYSADLYEAERSYLAAQRGLAAIAAHKGVSATDPNAMLTRERLRLLDLTDEQIEALDESKIPERRTTLLAHAGGTVLKREVLEGGAIEAGREIFQLADLSSLWLLVDLFESDLPHVGVGTEASCAIVGRAPIRGKVSFVEPTFDETTRTGRARIDVDNSDGTLKPGMYADVELSSDLGEQLVVAADAVVDTGERQLVFVAHPDGRFEPREVTVGDRSGDHAVVLTGVAEGERVVTSATFLVDSESRLQAVLRTYANDGG